MRRLVFLLAVVPLLLMPSASAKGGEIEVVAATNEVVAAPGTIANATFTLRNAGQTAAEVSLRAEAHDFATLREATFSRAAFSLGQGEEATVTARIVVPADAPSGRHGIWLVAGGGAFEAYVPVWVTVGGSNATTTDVNLVLDPAQLEIFVPVGRSATQAWRVHNPYAEMVSVNITVQPLPAGWRALAQEGPIFISPYGTAQFEVTFEADAHATETQSSLWGTRRVTDSFALFSQFTLHPIREPEPLLAGLVQREIELSPGETGTVMLHIENRNAWPADANISVVSTGAGAVEVSPASLVTTLDARTARDIPVTVRFSDDATANGYVTVRVQDGAQNHVSFLTVRLRGAGVAAGDPLAESEGLGIRPAVAAGFVAGGVGVGALGVILVNRRYGLALAALYTRLRPARMLDSEKRRAIVAVIRESPGITMSDLQRRLGLANGEMRHHLSKLASARLIATTTDGNKRRLWPVAMGAQDTGSLAERALARLPQGGGARMRDLARDLGVSPQALHYHLKRLHAEGAIVAKLEGGHLVVARPS